MQIVSLRDNLHETARSIFWGNKKNIVLLFAEILISMQSVNLNSSSLLSCDVSKKLLVEWQTMIEHMPPFGGV